MPSGRTHDSITLWSLPIVAGGTFALTQSGNLTLLVSGGFLFGGLMFGPDLDIYSQQYKRWGILRWIWLPYRKQLRHRSIWSHGLIVGTTGRILYLAVWLVIFSATAILIGAIARHGAANWQHSAQQDFLGGIQVVARSMQQFSIEWIALIVGLELGAMSHSLSDWIGSAIKRRKKRSKR